MMDFQVIWVFFQNMSKKIQDVVQSNKNWGHSTWIRIQIYDNLSPKSSYNDKLLT